MKNLRHWLAGLLLVLLTPTLANAADDPFLGHWKLDKTKSTIARDPGVKNKEFVFAPSKDGVLVTETLELTTDNGEKHVSYLPYSYGKPVPQAGPGFDTFLVEKTDSNTALWTVKLKDKVLSQLQVVVSKDGKEMTFRYLSAASDPTNAVTKDRYVYVRQ